MGEARKKESVTLKYTVEANVFDVSDNVKFLVYKGELVEIRYRKEGGDLSITSYQADFSAKADEYTENALKYGNLNELVSYYNALGKETKRRLEMEKYIKTELKTAEKHVQRLQKFLIHKNQAKSQII